MKSLFLLKFLKRLARAVLWPVRYILRMLIIIGVGTRRGLIGILLRIVEQLYTWIGR